MDSDRLTSAGLWDLPRVGGVATDEQGTVLVVPVSTTPQDTTTTVLWSLADDDPVALTVDDDSATNPAVSPAGTMLAFVRRVDAQRQVVVRPVADADGPTPDAERTVTDLPLGVLGSPRWVDEHRLLVVATLWAGGPTPAATEAWRADRSAGPVVHATERRLNRVWDTWYEDDATQHVLLVDTREDDPTPLGLTPGAWLLPDPLQDPGAHLAVTRDGSHVAFTTADAAGDEDGVPVPHLRVAPLDGSGAVVDLTPDAPGPVGEPHALPDGRLLVAIARERDFYAAPRDLWVVDPITGERELFVDGDLLDHGIESLAVGADGRTVVGTVREGRGRLVELRDGAPVSLAAPNRGSVVSPVVAGGAVYALASSLTEPPELARVGDADGEVSVVTSFARPAVADLELGRADERTVTGADGDPVQVLLLHPPAAAVDGPPPLVHLVHGGPHASFTDEWHWRWNAARFAAEGWLVALVNFHGSTGFGHAFTSSIHGDWPTKPTEDVLAATDALVAEGLVDGDRTAITGGSYGGYLVTWLCTVTDRFAAAVAHAAVTDYAGMWASDWSSSFDGAFGGRPWDDPSVMTRSPSSRYGRLSTPTLVVHGDRDLRVPIDQGRALYGALQDLGVPSRLLVFPDENHWVLDRRASERWYDEVVAWLQRYLG